MSRKRSPAKAQESNPDRAGAVLVGVAAVLMLGVSWRTWTDPLIDAGREIYIPWRLALGDRLYRDLAHEYAPLSPYINLAWLRLFGLGYHSLQIGNGLILAGILVLLFRVLRRAASAGATTAALLFGVLVFAFGQYGSRGNYNYMSPYSHQMTHGLLFSLLMLTALFSWADTGRTLFLGLAGLGLGLVFLTKYEFLVASLAAVLVCLTLVRQRPWRLRPAEMGAFAVSASVPFLASVAGLVQSGLSESEAIRATLGPYPYMLAPGLMNSPFYAHVSGLDHPGGTALNLLLWSALYAGLALVGEHAGAALKNHTVGLLAAFLVPLTALVALQGFLPWGDCLTPLPLVLAGRLYQLWRAGSLTPTRRAEAVLAAFSLALLLKTLLAPTMHGYGFALAFPGTLLAVTLAIDLLPGWVESRGLSRRAFAAAAFGLLTAIVGVHQGVSAHFRGPRTYPLGEGADRILTADRGRVLAAAVDLARTRVAADQTLAVFPEGSFVNYLARRKGPGHFVFLPPEFSMYGREVILKRLREQPPTHALVWSSEMRPMGEYGCFDYFKECAPDIGAWLSEDYAPAVVGMAQGQEVFTLYSRKSEGVPQGAPSVLNISLGAQSIP